MPAPEIVSRLAAMVSNPWKSVLGMMGAAQEPEVHTVEFPLETPSSSGSGKVKEEEREEVVEKESLVSDSSKSRLGGTGEACEAGVDRLESPVEAPSSGGGRKEVEEVVGREGGVQGNGVGVGGGGRVVLDRWVAGFEVSRAEGLCSLDQLEPLEDFDAIRRLHDMRKKTKEREMVLDEGDAGDAGDAGDDDHGGDGDGISKDRRNGSVEGSGDTLSGDNGVEAQKKEIVGTGKMRITGVKRSLSNELVRSAKRQAMSGSTCEYSLSGGIKGSATASNSHKNLVENVEEPNRLPLRDSLSQVSHLEPSLLRDNV